MDEYNPDPRDLSGIEYRNKTDEPDGELIMDGKVRLFGFSEAPPEFPSAPRVADCAPVVKTLKPNNYSWCTCGYGKMQPWCDNTHREAKSCTNRKSYKFTVIEEVTVELCMCKHTKNPPFCDGTHEAICSRYDEAGE